MARFSVFNAQGELVSIDTPRLELTGAAWQQRLSSEQFEVLRSKGTERPFCGNLLDNKMTGVYTCAGCGLPLFSSDSKFNSGTGWPSFFQPVAKENIAEERDESYGRARTEILCARCEGHLGHVFEDGPRPTGLRYCLNSAALNFTQSTELKKLADPAASNTPVISSASAASNAPSPNNATAIFAGGCFWCTEAAFEQLQGVSDVQSGYIGGDAATANYRRVCDGDTGHAEAIRITYNPAQISYDQLLDVFFDSHNPTEKNCQGADIGTQYRSAIFYSSAAERLAAEAKIKTLNAGQNYPQPIATTLEPASEFYIAEDYHQDYAQNNPNQPYVMAQAIPKACKIQKKHPQLIKKASETS